MFIEFDPAKDQANQAKHGVSLVEAESFEWDEAVIQADSRKEYGEGRYVAVGPLKGRLYVLVFVVRGSVVRAISLRKANAREVKYYANQD